jgi:hypothetical protein
MPRSPPLDLGERKRAITSGVAAKRNPTIKKTRIPKCNQLRVITTPNRVLI